MATRCEIRLRLGALLLPLLLTAAAARAEMPVHVELETFRVVTAPEGSERLEATEVIEPGAVLEYRATYTNRGTESVRGLTPRLPIPEETVYRADTASPAMVEASTDGESFAPIPLVRAVVRPDGRTSSEPVPYAEYRFLRWHIDELAPQESVSVRARVAIPERRTETR